MQITIDTNNLSDLDKQVLSLLVGGEVAAPAATPAKAEKAAPAPAKKAAAAPAKKAEPEPEETEEEVEETTADGPSVDDAIAKATAMVSNGQAAKVKAALNAVGAKRVSEVPADKVEEFLEALEG